MITFLIVSNTVRSSTKKSLKSVVGGQERFDVLARCLLNLDRWKKRLNTDLNLVFYLSHPEEQVVLELPLKILTSTLEGEQASIIQLVNIFDRPESFGLNFERISFNKLILRIIKTSSIYYLTPNGKPINDVITKSLFDSDLCFILGSQNDLSEDQETIIQEFEFTPTSLGQLDYLASHVITIICQNLDV